MVAQVKLQPAEDLVHVAVRGDVTAEAADEALALAIARGRETRCFRLLLDFREAATPDDQLLYGRHDLTARFGIRRTDRIALLCAPADSCCQAIERHARRAGLLIRQFDCEDDAIAWLERRILFPRLFRRFHAR